MKTTKKTLLLLEHEGGSSVDSANRQAIARIQEAERFRAETQKKLARYQKKIQTLAAAADGIESEIEQAKVLRNQRLQGLLAKHGIKAPLDQIKFDSVDKSRPFDVVLTWEEPVEAEEVVK